MLGLLPAILKKASSHFVTGEMTGIAGRKFENHKTKSKQKKKKKKATKEKNVYIYIPQA